jgi:hypothetical protein
LAVCDILQAPLYETTAEAVFTGDRVVALPGDSGSKNNEFSIA